MQIPTTNSTLGHGPRSWTGPPSAGSAAPSTASAPRAGRGSGAQRLGGELPADAGNTPGGRGGGRRKLPIMLVENMYVNIINNHSGKNASNIGKSPIGTKYR